MEFIISNVLHQKQSAGVGDFRNGLVAEIELILSIRLEQRRRKMPSPDTYEFHIIYWLCRFPSEGRIPPCDLCMPPHSYPPPQLRRSHEYLQCLPFPEVYYTSLGHLRGSWGQIKRNCIKEIEFKAKATTATKLSCFMFCFSWEIADSVKNLVADQAPASLTQLRNGKSRALTQVVPVYLILVPDYSPLLALNHLKYPLVDSINKL